MLYQGMHLSITSCLLARFKMSGTPRNKDSYIKNYASRHLVPQNEKRRKKKKRKRNNC